MTWQFHMRKKIFITLSLQPLSLTLSHLTLTHTLLKYPLFYQGFPDPTLFSNGLCYPPLYSSDAVILHLNIYHTILQLCIYMDPTTL